MAAWICLCITVAFLFDTANDVSTAHEQSFPVKYQAVSQDTICKSAGCRRG
jgi:hypothetical protein